MEAQFVIFDWDGTLMDSIPHIVSSMHSAIQDMQLEERTDEQVKSIIGLGLKEAICGLYPDLCEDDTFRAQFTERYRVHYVDTEPHVSKLFPGAAKLVRDLFERGLKLGIATGKSRAGLDRVLARTGLVDYFHASRCADETRSKPFPDMLLELMEEIKIPASLAVMIGDSIHDANMARSAGVDFIGITHGVQIFDELQKYNPLHCVHDIEELSSLFLTK